MTGRVVSDRSHVLFVWFETATVWYAYVGEPGQKPGRYW